MATHRPATVLTIAILHFVGGGLGLCCNFCGGGNQIIDRNMALSPNPPAATPQDRTTWRIRRRFWTEIPGFAPYTFANAAVGLVLALALIALGAGLLMMQKWAWYGTLAYCFLSLLHKVVVAGYVLGLLLPAVNAITDEEAAALTGPQASGFAFGLKLGAFGVHLLPLIFGVYPAVVLFLMLRPNVVRAFDSAGERRPRYDPEDD